MWKSNPDATIEDLDGKSGPGPRSLLFLPCWTGMEDDPQPVMLRYEASSYRVMIIYDNMISSDIICYVILLCSMLLHF